MTTPELNTGQALSDEELLYLPRDVAQFGATEAHIADLLITIEARDADFQQEQNRLHTAIALAIGRLKRHESGAALTGLIAVDSTLHENGVGRC